MQYVPQIIVLLMSVAALVRVIHWHGRVDTLKSRPWASVVVIVLFLSILFWGGFFDRISDGGKYILPQITVIYVYALQVYGKFFTVHEEKPVDGIVSCSIIIMQQYVLYCGGFYDVFQQ